MWLGVPEAAGASTLPLPFRAQHTVPISTELLKFPSQIILPKAHTTPEELQPSLLYVKPCRATWQEVVIQKQPLDFQHSALWRGMLFVPKNPGASQDHWVNTLFISTLPKHTNREQHLIDAGSHEGALLRQHWGQEGRTGQV